LVSTCTFLTTDLNNNKWIDELYTKIVLCNIDKPELVKLMNTGNYLVLNAMPFEYYMKDHIPDTFSLPADTVNKLKEEEVDNYIRDLLYNYPNLNKLINKKFNLKNIPIIVYCHHNKSDPGNKLIKFLWNIGYKNIKHYNGGMNEWNKK